MEVSKTNSPDTISRKRKRRDTYSVSPDSSLCSKAKMARFDSPVDGTPIIREDEAIHLSSPVSDEPSVELAPLNNPHNGTTESSSSSDEMNVEARPLFSPPSCTVESNMSGSRKRKRHFTFTVSSPEENVISDRNDLSLTAVDQFTPDNVSGDEDLEVSTGKSNRRSTFEIPPATFTASRLAMLLLVCTLIPQHWAHLDYMPTPFLGSGGCVAVSSLAMP